VQVIDPELSRNCAISLAHLQEAADYARSAASSLPIPSLNLDSAKGVTLADEVLTRFLSLCQPTRISRARRRIPMTSSMYGLPREFAGTNNARLPFPEVACGRVKSTSGRIVS